MRVLRGLLAQFLRHRFDHMKLVAQTGVNAFSDRHGHRPQGVGPALQRKVIDLAFEVDKLAGQRAALPDASRAQFRESTFGDAIANITSVNGHLFGRRLEGVRIGLSGPSRLNEDAPHRRFEHSAKCAGFSGVAFLLQTNGRRGLLAGGGDNLFGVLARRGNLSVGYAARLPDGDDRRKEGKNASDDGLPVVEKLVHSRMLYPALKRHGSRPGPAKLDHIVGGRSGDE
jgi:hypothetical protein